MESTPPGGRRPPPPSSAPAFDLGGTTEDCFRGGRGWWPLKAWGAPPTAPAAGPEASRRALWSLWFVVACLSLPTFVFISGVYRPALAFVSGVSSTPLLLSQGTPALEVSPPISTVAHLQSVHAPSPSPTSAQKLNSAVLHNAAAAAPSPAPVAGSSVVVQVKKAPMLAAGPSRSSDAGAHEDKLLGGLLAPGFDEDSCLSRYQSYLYRKASQHKPSPRLIHRLREYEALHRRCGPLTRSYRRALRLLKPGGGGGAPGMSSCKYVVWIPENGLGNRMLSMASAFLYALLSHRVLLMDGSTDLGGLFCEPFPGSWLLTLDFPLRHLPFGQKYPESYGNLLRTNRLVGTHGGSAPPGFVYAHLSNDYDAYDKRFYCESDQLLLEEVPWVVLRSDQYFVPALFLNRAFERELIRMFPEKEAVFHHLGRYLFHPSNGVWGFITGYYRDHLATAREKLGIQIRVFNSKLRPFDLILRQILNCTWSEKLLPEVDLRQHVTATTAVPSKAVLLASLHSVFFDKMTEMYSEHPATSGAVIGFNQPSHEEEEQTGRAAHDGKALAEMYLLSLTDALVTSSWSTFGYVAQGLAGTTPWVLQGPVHKWVPEPACVRDVSPEPCFHFPPDYDCEARGHADTTKLLPYTSHCEDLRSGVKLVDLKPSLVNYKKKRIT